MLDIPTARNRLAIAEDAAIVPTRALVKELGNSASCIVAHLDFLTVELYDAYGHITADTFYVAKGPTEVAGSNLVEKCVALASQRAAERRST